LFLRGHNFFSFDECLTDRIFGPRMVSSQDPFNEKSWVHLSDRIAAKSVGNATLAISLQRARFQCCSRYGETNIFSPLDEEL
jgi:hypothetical protein